MARKRFKPEEIMGELRQADAVLTLCPHSYQLH
jgi:hypothetical protein